MPDFVHTHHHSFERVELSEPDYQGLLRSLAGRLFPGFAWYFFNPPVQSPYGVAHPDGALVSETGDGWWVVEVELARHGIADHVDLQLRKLRDGWYGQRHFDHIVARYPEASTLLKNLNASDPQFLVIVDDRSALIEKSARDNDFDLLHVMPFRSMDQSGPLLYATCIEGRNPLFKARRTTGVAVSAEAAGGASRVITPQEDMKLSIAPSKVLVANRLVRAWAEEAGRGLVLAIDVGELRLLIGPGPYYWLVSESQEVARLNAIE